MNYLTASFRVGVVGVELAGPGFRQLLMLRLVEASTLH